MTCAGEHIYANNNTLDKLLAASWTSLQLPVTVSLPTLVFAGGVTYKPSRRQADFSGAERPGTRSHRRWMASADDWRWLRRR
jgi:hypothetical protein